MDLNGGTGGFTLGITNNQTMPGGLTRSDYIHGVGIGNVGKYAALQSPGGNGAIVLTFTSTAASPTTSPSFAPSTSKSKIIIIIIIIAIVIGSILFSGTIILYGSHFFSVLRSYHVTMDFFDDTRHNNTRSNQECNDISLTCPDEEVELPIIMAGKFYFDLIRYE